VAVNWRFLIVLIPNIIIGEGEKYNVISNSYCLMIYNGSVVHNSNYEKKRSEIEA